MTTVEDILAKLDKQTLGMVRKGQDISNEIIPTASFGLNLLLGGGFRVGKQHTIWGGEQSGKSAMLMQTIGINQSLGRVCAWIDAEHSFDPKWAARLGVQNDKLIVSQASTIADLTDLQVDLIRAGVSMLVIDSTAALMPKSFMADGEMKKFADTAQLGQMAKDLGQMCKMVQGINYSCAVCHISQVRVDVGASQMQKPFKPVGGKEVEHTDSFRVRLFSSKSDKEAIMADVQRGDMLIEEQVGRKVKWHVDKNKINGQYGTGDYSLYTSGSFVGVDRPSELLAYGVKYGVVNKGGAWYTIYGERFQGGDKANDYIRANPQVAEKLESEISAKSI